MTGEGDPGTSFVEPEIELLLNFNTSSFDVLETLKPYCILQNFDFDVTLDHPDSHFSEQLSYSEWRGGQPENSQKE